MNRSKIIKKQKNINITFVTCYYKMKSKFPNETYINWMKNLLDHVKNFYLVIYTNKETSDLFDSYKDNKKIKIIIKEFNQFYNYKYKDHFIKNHENNHLLKNQVEWNVNMLWSEKTSFVEDCIINNFFNTEYYGWCDIGYFRDSNAKGWPSNQMINCLNEEKIYYLLVNDIINYMKKYTRGRKNGLLRREIRDNQVSIAGGFYIGFKKMCLEWKKKYDQKLQLYFDNNRLVKDDQIIILDCIMEDENFFQLIKSNRIEDWFYFKDYLLDKKIIKKEKISILMPIYNGIEFIKESVNSVLKQTYTDWELIIGINGHPQNSEIYKQALRHKSDKIKIYDLYQIKGKSNALNKMLQFCSGNWVSLLDVDDIWLERKLENQVNFIKDYDVIGTQCKYFGDSDLVPSIPTGDITNFDFRKVNPIINSSCLLKKELCYWDGKHDGVEDYDLWLRLRNKNKKFYNIEDVHVLHRIHQDSSFNAKGNSLKVRDVLNKNKI